jgi:hypothetical protein
LADTQPVGVRRDSYDEALLSSAPKPFGTTSHDLAAVSGPKRGDHKWLWASLGLLAVILISAVTGTLLWRRAPRAVAEDPKVEPVAVAPIEVEPDAEVADVGTDAPVMEPVVVEETVVQEAVVDKPVEEEAPPVRPKAKKRKPRKKKAVTGAVVGTGAVAETPPAAEAEIAADTPAASETEGAAGTETETETGATGAGSSETAAEIDDGIDWTVPDFPEEPSPPTGTPDAPARNPVVIDEPPSE